MSAEMKINTKLKTLVKHINAEDWDKAILVAGKFHDLGDHKDAIRLAYGAVTNPHFYTSIGKDIEKLRMDGIKAIKERYDKYLDYEEFSAEAVKMRVKSASDWAEASDVVKKEIMRVSKRKRIFDIFRKKISVVNSEEEFEYFGSVKFGVDLHINENKIVTIKNSVFDELLSKFSGQDLAIVCGPEQHDPSLDKIIAQLVGVSGLGKYVASFLEDCGYALVSEGNIQLSNV